MESLEKKLEQLDHEIRELRSQLAEALATLQAIRTGEVDALVVSAPEGQRVFTLESADQTYRTIVEQMQEGAVTLLEDGFVSYSNRRFAELIKRPLEETIGVLFQSLVSEADQDHFHRLVHQALQGGARGELTLQAADGTARPVQVSMSLLHLDELPALCMVVTDLRERKRAEAVLASEQHYRFLFDRNPDGVFALDPAGRFIVANPACEQLTGYSVPELLEKTFCELCAADQLPAVRAHFQQNLSGQEGMQLETTLVHRDGRHVEVWGVGGPVFVDGQVVAVYCTAKDITERKRAERCLREAKAAAETANVAKGRFLANMSHELRTPMNAILGMIEVALPKAADPTVRDCLQTAKDSADLLLTLLDDLLDSAKIESGKFELESAPFNLRQMLQQITRVLSVRAGEKGLTFICRVPEDAPEAVVGDRLRLQQVLLNLAGNAIKFTERGEVEISVHTQSHDEDVSLEFAVRDTGIGISPSELERLFEPFAQADPSTTRRFGGTGLGLTISKSLVELMGGRIRVDSEVGRGSTFAFTVRLPLTDEAPDDFDVPTLPEAASAQLRILLVEDNPANQKLATYLLQDRGHLVDVAADGHEAIRLAEQNDYDVILMDVQMPGMGGLEATAAIRRRETGSRQVPIIAMTAHAMKGDRQRCLAAGMNGYISKPVNAQAMIGLVENLAQRSSCAVQTVSATSLPEEPPPSTTTTTTTTTVVFDPDTALQRCFNNREMLRQMVGCFFEEVDQLLPQMHEALDNGELAELSRLAHRLKGTVVYLGAERASEAAHAVERMGRANADTLSDAEESLGSLEHECLLLKDTLGEHLRVIPR